MCVQNFLSKIEQIRVIFTPLQVVGRSSATQLQVGENLNKLSWQDKG